MRANERERPSQALSTDSTAIKSDSIVADSADEIVLGRRVCFDCAAVAPIEELLVHANLCPAGDAK